MKQIVLVIICLFSCLLNVTDSVCAKEPETFISYKINKNFENVWDKIDDVFKKNITHYLTIELGLSSTGQIQLIGNYRLTKDCDLGKEKDQILHFIQQDLFESRLVWSCLINTKNYKVQILYPNTRMESIKH